MGIGDQYGWVTLADGTSVPPNDPRALQYYQSDQAGFLRSNPNYDPSNGQNSVTGNDGLNHGQGSYRTPVTGGDQFSNNPNALPLNPNQTGQPDGPGDGSGFGGPGNTLGLSYNVSNNGSNPQGSNMNSAFANWVHVNGPQSWNGQFELQQNETPEQWLSRVQNSGPEGLAYASRIKSDPTFSKFIQPAPGAPNNGGQNTPGTLDYNSQIADFYRRMTAPLDMNDPEVKQAIATGVSATQRQGNMSGVSGGLSQMGLARSAMSAQLGLANQRRQMGLQALTLGSNRDLGLGTEAGVNSRFSQDMAQSNAINAQSSQRANLQALAAAGGQVANGITQFGGKGGGGSGGSSGGDYSGSNSNTPSFDQGFGQGGSSSGSDPSNWENPF